MKERKVPMRTCLGCGSVFPKKALVRVVRTPEGQVQMDLTGKAPGRGAYICKSQVCLEKAVKAKRISRAFEVEVTPEVISHMRSMLEVGSESR